MSTALYRIFVLNGYCFPLLNPTSTFILDQVSVPLVIISGYVPNIRFAFFVIGKLENEQRLQLTVT